MNPTSGLLVLSIVTLKGAFKINELIKCNKKLLTWSADLKIADLLGWPCQCLNSGPSKYLFAFYLASYQRNTWYLVSQLASWTTKTCRGHCLMPTIVLLLMMMMRIFLKPLKRTLMKGHQPTKITKWRSWLLKTSSLICKGLPCCQTTRFLFDCLLTDDLLPLMIKNELVSLTRNYNQRNESTLKWWKSLHLKA